MEEEKKIELDDEQKIFENHLSTACVFTNWEKRRFKEVGNLQKVIRNSQKLFR